MMRDVLRRPAAPRTLAFALLLGFLASGGASAALPKETPAWHRVDTEHFTLFSNATEKKTIEIGAELERFREAITRLMPDARVNSPLPMYIYVFRNAASFKAYKKDADGKPGNEAGYFLGTREGNYVAIDANANRDPFRIIYHEYVHYFNRNNVRSMPTWLDEGLAELYSTFRVENERAGVGYPIETHLAWLARNPAIPLPELFAIDPSSTDYNEGRRQGTFYAQSWALTHYLMTRDDEGEEWWAPILLARLDEGVDPTDALLEAVGMDLPTLEAKLAQYIKSKTYKYFWIPFESGAGTTDVRVEPLDRSDALTRLADLLAHHPPIQFEEAEKHLKEALRLNSKNARAWEIRGILAERRDDPSEAARSFEISIDLGAPGPRVYALYGHNLLHEFIGDKSSWNEITESTPPLLLKAREMFRNSLALAPDDPVSLAGLGKTFLLDRSNMEEGLVALTRATELLPSRVDILADLTVLMATSGNRAGARTLLEQRILPEGSPDQIRVAEQGILNAAIQEAESFFQGKQYDEARDVIGEVLDRSTDPDVRRRAARALEDFSSAAEANLYVEIYNKAVEAAQREEWDTALSGLREVEESSGAPLELRESSRKARLQLERQLLHAEHVERYNEAVDLFNAGETLEARLSLRNLLREDVEPNLRAAAEDLIRRIP